MSFIKITTYGDTEMIQCGDRVELHNRYLYAKHRGERGIVTQVNYYDSKRSLQMGVIKLDDGTFTEFISGERVLSIKEEYFQCVGYEQEIKKFLGIPYAKLEHEVLREIKKEEFPTTSFEDREVFLSESSQETVYDYRKDMRRLGIILN